MSMAAQPGPAPQGALHQTAFKKKQLCCHGNATFISKEETLPVKFQQILLVMHAGPLYVAIPTSNCANFWLQL